jgi:hypothetical protein
LQDNGGLGYGPSAAPIIHANMVGMEPSAPDTADRAAVKSPLPGVLPLLPFRFRSS